MAGAKHSILTILKASALAAAGSAALAATASAQSLPAAGHPGCYAKIAYPPAYRRVAERVQGPPVVSYRDIPAVIEHDARQVLVSPARVEHETIAPIYRTTWRWTEVPGPVRQVLFPPVYRTVTERRLISPAHLAWRPGGAAHGFAPSEGYGQGGGVQARATGEVLCRVLVPARYAWISRHVMVSPGHEITVHGRPCRVRVKDRVLVRPGRIVDHAVAAVYRTVDETHVVHPASRQRIVRPGPVRIVSRRVLAAPAHYGWAPIVCTPHSGYRRPAPMLPQPAQSYGGGQSYGAPPAAAVQTYGDVYSDGAARPASRAYRPDDLLAPTPNYPPTRAPPLVPAPYDVGHPAPR